MQIFTSSILFLAASAAGAAIHRGVYDKNGQPMPGIHTPVRRMVIAQPYTPGGTNSMSTSASSNNAQVAQPYKPPTGTSNVAQPYTPPGAADYQNEASIASIPESSKETKESNPNDKTENAPPKGPPKLTQAEMDELVKKFEKEEEALRNIDITFLIQDNIMPPIVAILDFGQQFSGKHIILTLRRFRGRVALETISKIDLTNVWAAYHYLDIENWVKTTFNINLGPLITPMYGKNGADLLASLQKMTSADMANFVVNILDLFGLTPALESALNTDMRRLLTKVLPSGQEILKYIEYLNGDDIADHIEKMSFHKIEISVNDTVNKIMTLIRNKAASDKKKKMPPVYTGFELSNFINVLQDFVQDLVELEFPSVLQNLVILFNGQRINEQTLKISYNVFVIAINPVRITWRDAKTLWNNRIKPYLNPVKFNELMETTVNQLLKKFSKFKGSDVFNENKHPFYGIFYELTGVNLHAYVVQLVKLDGKRTVKNIKGLSGRRLRRLLDDLGVSEYLEDFPGMNYKLTRTFMPLTNTRMILLVVGRWKVRTILKMIGINV